MLINAIWSKRILSLAIVGAGCFLTQQAFAESADVKEPVQVSVTDTVASPYTSPQFPGGKQGLKKYVATNLKYPKKAVKEKTQGIVVCRFIVDEVGKVTDAEVVRSVSPELDKEALRIVNSLPDWTPAMMNGEPQLVGLLIPIKFNLSEYGNAKK